MKSNPLTDYQTQTLRRVQQKQLAILQEVIRICNRHEIPYWLDGGTLLGAVRHGGFIPWDDDVDISMRRNDLERFQQIAPTELPPHLFLQTRQTDPALPAETYKVRDRNSFYLETTDNAAANYHKGVFIDIFPFIDYPARFLTLTRKVARGICIARSVLATPRPYSARGFAQYLYFRAKLVALKGIWLCLLQTKNKQYTCSEPAFNWYGTVYRTDTLFPLRTIDFEGIAFRAPADVDAYLQAIYGDYRQLPPPEKRAVHAVFFQPELIPKDTKE